MKATYLYADEAAGRLAAVLEGLDQEWFLGNSDVGGYYAPRRIVGRTTRLADGELHDSTFVELRFPNSAVRVEGRAITIEGLRGSIADCIVPLLLAAGVDPTWPGWQVETTRPDVPWYRRAGRREEAASRS